MCESCSKPKNNSCLLGGTIAAVTLIVLTALCLLGGCYMCSRVMDISQSAQIEQAGKVKILSEKTLLEGDSLNKIAVIYIDDVIGSKPSKTESTLHELNQAAHDSKVKAIALYIDSPGGAVTTSDVIYNAVLNAKSQKPVVVYMNDIAASGGYYISCAADHITANPNTLTGSIGVIISTFNLSDVMDKVGVRATSYTSGAFKDMLSPTRKPTRAEEEYVQSLVNEAYGNFLDVVSKGRNISIDDLKARNAVDGRVLSGRKALELGLVDANGYFEDALAEAEKRAGIPENSAEVFRYKRNDFEDIFNSLFAEARGENKMKVELMPQVLPQLKPGVPYMLPSFYATGTSHEQH